MATEYDGVDELGTMQQGIASAGEQGNNVEYQRECADVKKWMATIKQARSFDEQARKDYAMNRRTARGDRGGYEVSVPICQSYIDVMTSFLYAKDPQVSVMPSGMTEPPPAKDLEAMILDQQQQQPPMGQSPGPGMIDNASPMAMAGGMSAGPQPMQGSPNAPPPAAASGGLAGILAKFAPGLAAKLGAGAPAGTEPPMPQQPPPDPEMQIQQQVQALLAPYQRKRNNAKQLATTMELVITNLWKKAKLKSHAKLQVKSALTIGPGVLKAVWLERMGEDPAVRSQIDDLMELMARMNATKQQIDSDQTGITDTDAEYALLEQQQVGLQAKVEVMVARGFVIEFIAAEDFQCSIDVPTLGQYQDASWLGNRFFRTVDQAKADYPDIADKLDKLAVWKPKKPKDTSGLDVPFQARGDITASEADAYTKGNEDGESNMVAGRGDGCVCFWEIWDRETGNVLTFAEGLECYAKKPHVAEVPSTRGHPYFLYAIGSVDGQRHPRSLPTRSESLFNEYNARRTGSAKHRRRAIPKMAFDSTNYDADEIAKLEAGDTGEMIGLRSMNPEKPIKDCLVPVAYNNYDEALYDTREIRGELETVWGIQEADAQGIQTAKTATEAGIQQESKQSRTGYLSSDLDSMLEDLAQYTGEVAIQKMAPEDVESIAGPWALWPQGMTIEDLSEMVSINIQAGSSGKPATQMEQQVWAALLPTLQTAVKEIGQLRGSDPEEIADCLESIVQETINRAGDNIDASQFLPDPPRQPPPPPPGPPPLPLMDSALMGPQTLAMLQILADVKGRILSPGAAKGALMASYPHLPPETIEQMVSGSTPLPGDPATELNTAHASTVQPPAPMPANGTSAPTGVTP